MSPWWGRQFPVTTAAIEDRAQLGDALRSAIRDVLDHAIGFTPTVVTLGEKATVVGNRLYILLFLADEDGESTIEALSTGRAPESTPADGTHTAGHPATATACLPEEHTEQHHPELAPSL